MLSDSEKALAEMMAAQFMDKGDAAAVEPAEGTVKIRGPGPIKPVERQAAAAPDAAPGAGPQAAPQVAPAP